MSSRSVSRRALLFAALLTLVILLFVPALHSQQVTGAIFTSDSTGALVNGNLYEHMEDVYLNGGPRTKCDPTALPPGNYYFMVTNPAGTQLLSSDDISQREVTVAGGVITAYTGSHAQGPNKCEGISVALFPYGVTDNNGGEYKAWMIPVDQYDAVNCKANFGFCDAGSKTDNFKVKTSVKGATVTVCKFNDLNLNGAQDNSDPASKFYEGPLAWKFGLSGADIADAASNHTVWQSSSVADGCTTFSVSNFDINTGWTSETVIVSEAFQGLWLQGAPSTSTSCGLDECVIQCLQTDPTTFSLVYDSATNLPIPAPCVSSATGASYPLGVSRDPISYDTTVFAGAGTAVQFKLHPGDNVTVPRFGNNCIDIAGGCVDMPVSKGANPVIYRKYKWDIDKHAQAPKTVNTSGSATFTYDVLPSHDPGTDVRWQVRGTINIHNGTQVGAIGVTLSDSIDNGGACLIKDANGNWGNPITVDVPALSDNPFDYVCEYKDADGNYIQPTPDADGHLTGHNTATMSFGGQSEDSGAVFFSFADASINGIDDAVTVTDTYGGPWTVKVSDCAPSGGSLPAGCTLLENGWIQKDLNYSYEFIGDTPGTCTNHTNYATFKTNTTETAPEAPVSDTVKVCVGADPTVSKTASPAYLRTYTWAISKVANPDLVKEAASTTTVNFTVDASQTGFTDSGWQVSGVITVTNPNDWESIPVSVSDAIDNGGVCVVGPSLVSLLAPGESRGYSYKCTYAAQPAAAFTNTATITWVAATAFTPHSSATGTASGSFAGPTSTSNKVVTINDYFNYASSPSKTLGTLTATDAAPWASGSYPYSTTVNVPKFNCVPYRNVGKIEETGQTATATVTVCGPEQTGALTMGFWQNKNGQNLIKSATGPDLYGWLRTFNAFNDLTATSSTGIANYVMGVIKAANASGTSMNAMLKAQMLATALDAYFIPGLASKPVDLTKICASVGSCASGYENAGPAFGGATSLTITQILLYQNNVTPYAAPLGWTMWYANVKAIQELAKDTFDAINNQVVFAP